MAFLVFLALFRTAFASRLELAPGVCETKTPAIGVLSLDGYYWPTQPGDISDLRTWCPTGGPDPPDYTCKHEKDQDGDLYFDVIHERVDGATWIAVRTGNTDGLHNGFKKAVANLLSNKNVCAVVGHAGFFSFYQTFVEEIVDELCTENNNLFRKPILLGTPLLIVPFSQHGTPHGIPSWELLKEPKKDKVLVVTSNYPDLERNAIKKVLSGFVKRFGLTEEIGKTWAANNSENVFSLGWNNMPGYGVPVVRGALFHNAFNTLNNFEEQMKEALQNASAMGMNIVGIIMESTEMPMHSNSVRKLTNLPVWDISTLGKCLMRASNTFNRAEPGISNQVFNNEAFRECMMSWDAKKYETLFGRQLDGRLKHYEDTGLSVYELAMLHCSGGRPGKMNVGRRMIDFPTGAPDLVSPFCSETPVCLCEHCKNLCPGAGNCGAESAPCGVRGEGNESEECKKASQVSDFDMKTCGLPESNLVIPKVLTN